MSYHIVFMLIMSLIIGLKVIIVTEVSSIRGAAVEENMYLIRYTDLASIAVLALGC
jgi:hypothetical protein